MTHSPFCSLLSLWPYTREQHFFFAFSFFQIVSRCIDSFFFFCPWVRVFAQTLSEALAGLLGVFRAELPGLQQCQHHIQGGSQASQISGASSPASWGGGCLLPWLSPFLALEPVSFPWAGTCLPHPQFTFKHAAVMLAGHARGVVQGKKVPLPFQPGSFSPASLYPVCPFSNFPGFP